ncbi:hypothetical protein D0Z07_9091 [Hyphodiscus hymeniophilus]|uniref:DUF924-domain-containing protein n=1 Tax=Hyphodiscus hymeniophilus TaxID=353542 RepID=A0A9P6VD32_9HELO|nr:hypothetical protein D0Z07_9091 [Hyphodiscus hymeniophilus]
MRGYNVTSAFQKVIRSTLGIFRADASHQILGFQAMFRSTIQTPFSSFRSMSSTMPMDPDINRTMSYWFDGPEPQKKWFAGGPAVDAEIRDQFGGLVEKARAHELGSWTSEPVGTLALIILLDQFPRNIFRGTPSAFSSDPQALNVTTTAIAKGFDRSVSHTQQSFFYLPLMHGENLLSQVAGVALTEAALARCEPNDSELKEYWERSIKFAYSHRDSILKFGRFPSRNEAIGRESTPEEIAYLKENPSGF